MSKSNRLGKLYDRLTPEERFKLSVEAHTRGDERESRRLVDSCPIRNYTMTEWAFSGRWQTATEIVLAVCADLCEHMSRLNMIDALRQTLPYAHTVYQNEAGMAYMSGHEAGSRYAWERAGMGGEPPGWEALEDEEAEGEDFDPAAEEAMEALESRIEDVDIMPVLLEKLERKVAGQAWTVWEAFAGFSRSTLDIEPEKLLQVLFEPALSGVEDLKRRKAELALEVDNERAAEYEKELCECWEHYLRGVRKLGNRP